MTTLSVFVLVLVLMCLATLSTYKLGYEDGKEDGLEEGREIGYIRAMGRIEETEEKYNDIVKEFGIVYGTKSWR